MASERQSGPSSGQQLAHAPPLFPLGSSSAKDRPQPQDGTALGNGLPAINVPKGGGAIRSIGEKFSVSAATGTASVSIPVPVSGSRAGFQPDLSLSYDSGAGNGAFGFGWHMSIPSIARKTDQGLPQYQDSVESDTYTISGAEDLVPVLTRDSCGKWSLEKHMSCWRDASMFEITMYKPRIESAFARIERWTAVDTHKTHWRSISRSNVTTIFGEDDNSRLFDPDRPHHIFQWLASRTFDDKGNAMVFEYKPEDPRLVNTTAPHEIYRPDGPRTVTRYPKRIKYGNRVSSLLQAIDQDTQWMFEVVFDYGDHDIECPTPRESNVWTARSDPFSTYRAGFEVRTYRLCRRVLMFHHFPGEVDVGTDTLVSSLDISYHKNGHVSSTSLSTASCASSFQKVSYVRDGSGYTQQGLPPIEFVYSEAKVSNNVSELSHTALESLPVGLSDPSYQWLDLDGEGIPGILVHEGGAYFYKSNLGDGRFGPVTLLPQIPSLYSGKAPAPQWLDLVGDGRIEMVRLDGTSPGFYKRGLHEDWEPFKTFKELPNIRWNDPNLKFIDLSGDGKADVLIADDDILIWHAGLAEDGFGPASYWRPPMDENQGPRLLISDGLESIYTADMTGDGLSDLVRIRNGEICYWPNLGYGRFGCKASMSNPPWFDFPDCFRQSRLHLADIDGSGTTDILYVNGNETKFFLNQAGNGWTHGHCISSFPNAHDGSNVQVIDLLGKGTACLVWSSALPGDSGRQLRYVDLMQAGKPYMLTTARNNVGSETQYSYISSNHFYLQDKAAGKPWITKLPFPVQVVERMEVHDLISRNRFVTRYTYHHGYWDGIEREFRGFGMVETYDTEEYSTLMKSDKWKSATNVDITSNSPPALTRTWFHTGIDLLSCDLTRAFETEYFQEPNISKEQAQSLRLPSSTMPASLRLGSDYVTYRLTPSEVHQSYRALKGFIVHQEIYALDGTEYEGLPYSVTRNNYKIELLQPQMHNKFAIFFATARQSVELAYERKLYDRCGKLLADPRITQSFTLATDEYGNVLETVSLSRGRRYPDPNDVLTVEDRASQERNYAIFTKNTMTNSVSSDDDWLTPLPAETYAYEILKLVAAQSSLDESSWLMTWDCAHSAVQRLALGRFDVPFEDFEGLSVTNHPARRLLQRIQTLYRKNDLSDTLPLGQVESLALPEMTLKQAFSEEQIRQNFVSNGKLPAGEVEGILHRQGGYVQVEGDSNWWVPSSKTFFSYGRHDTPAQELEQGRAHFFHPVRSQDIFSTEEEPIESFIKYDKYDLTVLETQDPVGNRTTIGERNLDPNKPLVRHGFDYRILQPVLVMDQNRNLTTLAYDIMGMAVGSAVAGKPEEHLGDSLQGFDANISQESIQNHFQEPFASINDLLTRASTRSIYDYHAFFRTRDSPQPQPNWASTLTRETHVSDLSEGQESRVIVNFVYSDGFARTIQQKLQAEPERGRSPDSEDDSKPLEQKHKDRGTSTPNWIGDGWVVYNNKGKPVRQFEPFFTNTHQFEYDAKAGVSPIIFYDPIQRAVATVSPDHTWSKIVFDPWSAQSWDANDTVLINDPRDDPHVGDYFRRLPPEDYLPTWYTQRIDGSMGPEGKLCAERTALHAGTPKTTFSDALGRAFASCDVIRTKRSNTDHISEEPLRSHVIMDIQGNQQRVFDPEGRLVSRARYNYNSALLYQQNMENAERWILTDATGKHIYAWNARKQQIRSVYDKVRRLTNVFITDNQDKERLVERMVYGETEANPEDGNTRGRVIRVYDQAGVTYTDSYDFKGNTNGSRNQLAREYRSTLDWSEVVEKEPQVFKQRLIYDALNRVVRSTFPDGSITTNLYNVRGQIQSVTTLPRGASNPIVVTKDAGYNAKGQRTFIAHGNGTTTSSTYDPLTFRLLRIVTRRNRKKYVQDDPHPQVPAWAGANIQNLHYTYDPSGNITSTIDSAQQTIFFRNKRVSPSQEFTYDSMYRLIEASGREHLGQADNQAHVQSTGGKDVHVRFDHPHDGHAMGRYFERYYYDKANNVLRLQHENTTSLKQWTRHYEYTEPSFLEPGRVNNRLSRTKVGSTVESYTYEGLEGLHGNMTSMPTILQLHWNYRDQLSSTGQQDDCPDGTVTWYRYDSTGKRIRKVTETRGSKTKSPVQQKETLYIGGMFEVFRKYSTEGEVKLEIETVNIIEGGDKALAIENKTAGENPKIPPQLLRYQYKNQQGSVALELDDTGQVISYEEFSPFGNSSYAATGNQTEVSKRYRYVGKERDDSGLYYMGARYYAPWLGRWTSSDPLGLVDGPNLFVYAHNNPIMMADPSGTDATGTIEHNKIVKAIDYILTKAGRPGAIEQTVKGGLGGSRLDWLARRLSWGSVEVKTMNMFHYYEDGKLLTSKLNDALAGHVEQGGRHLRHLRAFTQALGRRAGKEGVAYVVRGFAKGSEEFAEFSSHVKNYWTEAKGAGKVAVEVFNRSEPEILTALKAVRTGEDLAIKADTVTNGLVKILKSSAGAAARVASRSSRGAVDLGLLGGMVKGLGYAAMAYHSVKDVGVLRSNASTDKKVDAGTDLVGNVATGAGLLLAAQPLEIAGASLAAGAAVGGAVADKVEQKLVEHHVSEPVAAGAGAFTGVLAGAAAGAAVGAFIGTFVPIPGVGTAGGAAIGALAGAAGASIKILWGSH